MRPVACGGIGLKTGKMYRAVRPCIPKSREPLELKKGDLVSCIREDDEYKGWFFCEKGSMKGWVPVDLVELLGEVMGRIKEDYSSRELALAVGDEVVGLRIVSGWLWGKKDGFCYMVLKRFNRIEFRNFWI